MTVDVGFGGGRRHERHVVERRQQDAAVQGPEVDQAIEQWVAAGGSVVDARIVETLLESYPLLIVNHKAFEDNWKRGKLETLSLLLKGALNARDMVGLKMNLQQSNLKNLLEALPALRNPTISPLAQAGWVAVETVIEEKIVREIIPRLKALGAEGIIEYPLNKVVY